MVEEDQSQAKDEEPLTPRSIYDAEVKLPESLPGALAENSAGRPDEFGVPREKAEIRLPEATEEALRDESE